MNHDEGNENQNADDEGAGLGSEIRKATLIGESHAELCSARERIHREIDAAQSNGSDVNPVGRAILAWIDDASALLSRLAIDARERISDDPPRRVGRPRGRRK